MGKKAMRDSAAGAAPVQRMTGAALASQEPVAEVLLVDGEKVIDASMAFFDSVELGTKLYLAAGAAPIQLTDDQLDEIADRCTPNTETGSLNYKMFAREVLTAAGAAPGKPEHEPALLQTEKARKHSYDQHHRTGEAGRS
mgnify:FL=1